jgi:CrcB protein
MVREWVAVALGGMLGSLARFALMGAFSLLGAAWLPIATLAANTAGCLAIGWLGQWAFQQGQTDHWLVVGVRVGLLGGLTTFSSFALDIFRIWQSGRHSYSVTMVVAHLALGISAVVLGISLARLSSPIAPEN